MIVAGISPSLDGTGVAVLTDGEPTLARAVGARTTRDGWSHGHRSDRIVHESRTVVDLVRLADLAVFEDQHYRDQRPSARDDAGLWWGIYSALRHRRIPIAVVPITVMRTWATGRDGAPTPAEPDLSAMTLALMGTLHLGGPMHFEIRHYHRTNLARVDWPEVPSKSCAKPEISQVGAL